MEIPQKSIVNMRRSADACMRYVNALSQGGQSPEKIHTLIDAAMQNMERCCIEMRLICETVRPSFPTLRLGCASYHTKEAYGEVTKLANGWLDIRLNALLPHCKTAGGTQYTSDTVTRLLNRFRDSGGELPFHEKAFLAIVERCPKEIKNTAFDQDNKGFKGVINALKGRLFEDDDQFSVSLGLFSIEDEDACCHIYVMPLYEAGDFFYQLAEDAL